MKNKKNNFIILLTILILVLAACTNKNEVTPTENDNIGSDKTVEVDSNYPKKPVEVVVGFGAGGETDTLARLVFQYAAKYFGEDFAIINKPGASGEIAWAEVAKAKPDGYTIAFINPPTFVAHPVQRENATYQIEDYKMIANMVKDPACVVVPKDSEINSMKEFIEKSKEESITIGYSGPGSSESLTLRQLEDEHQVQIEKVPYDGSASSIVALLGGQIDSCILNVSGAINFTNDDSIKVIGVAARERSNSYPEVPTFEEEGINIFNEAFRGVAAPKDTPDEIVEKIDEAIKEALEDPEFIKRADEMQVPIHYMDSEKFSKVIEEINQELEEEFEKGEW